MNKTVKGGWVNTVRYDYDLIMCTRTVLSSSLQYFGILWNLFITTIHNLSIL